MILLFRSPRYLRRYVSCFCDLSDTVLIRLFRAARTQAAAGAAVIYGHPSAQRIARQPARAVCCAFRVGAVVYDILDE